MRGRRFPRRASPDRIITPAPVTLAELEPVTPGEVRFELPGGLLRIDHGCADTLPTGHSVYPTTATAGSEEDGA